jgi:plastocyanin
MRSPAFFAAVATVTIAFITSPASAARTANVSLEDVRFTPSSVQVKRGDRVRWTWNDGATPHNVSSRGTLRFRSSSTKTRGIYVVRFNQAGTHRYLCTIHPGMAGKVVVR